MVGSLGTYNGRSTYFAKVIKGGNIVMAILILCAIILWFAIFALLLKTRQSKLTILTTMVIIIFSSSCLYLTLGGWRQVQAQYAYDNMVEVLQSLHESPNIDASMVDDALAELGDQLPDHPFVWFKLGEIYEKLAWFDKAKQSYAQALKLAPNIDTKIKYAYASALSQGGILDLETLKIIESILDIDSSHMAALNLLAMDAYKNSDFIKAANIWEGMLSIADDSTGTEITAIHKALDKALEQLPTDEYAKLSHPFRIRVSVSFSTGLMANIPENSSVYVFAKLKDGKGPPLAVLKLSPSALPQNVWLSGANSMAKGVTLDKGQDIIVTARISQTGPIAQVGDIEAKSEPIHITGVHSTHIIIDDHV
jgi:cytochrome c-type biogenesis protein CcmH/NrfG